MTSLAELTDLAVDGSSTVDGHDVEPVHIAAVILEVVGNLQTEFARGAENDQLRVACRGVDVLQRGQTVSGCFARSRLSECNDIALGFGRVGVVEQAGDDRLLHRSGGFVAHFTDGGKDFVLHAQFGKCFQEKMMC